MADVALQRKNMVESQVRPSDVTDRRVIRAMLELPREAFVPAVAKAVAYMDGDVMLSPGGVGKPGRSMMAPRTLARLVQLLEAAPGDRALVVGAGTGYSAAVLGRMVGKVVAVEPETALSEAAAAAVSAAGSANVTVIKNDLVIGAPAEGPYDVILLDGAVERVPQALLDQLAEGGRMVGIVVSGGLGKAMLWRRIGGLVDGTVMFEAQAPMLPGLQEAMIFAL